VSVGFCVSGSGCGELYAPRAGVCLSRRRPCGRSGLYGRSRRRWVSAVGMSEDLVVIGGGVAGLSTALRWAQTVGSPVRVVSRAFAEAAGNAAAGMLAPDAERLHRDGILYRVGQQSRGMYPAWVREVEQAAGIGVDLQLGDGAMLVPIRQGSDRWESEFGDVATWLSSESLAWYEPGLTQEGHGLQGAWQLNDDGQVDNRQLMTALQRACRNASVTIDEGCEVLRLNPDSSGKRIVSVVIRDTTSGITQELHGNRFLMSNGAWLAQLLSVPVKPIKGQMLSLRDDVTNRTISSAIFASDVYLVPKKDGRIIIGATEEDVGFDGSVTPGGLNKLLTSALILVPGLSNLPVLEHWSGLRPTTPDRLPVVGETRYSNVTVLGGLHRNGILLAPILSQVALSHLLQRTPDEALIREAMVAFNPSRFRHSIRIEEPEDTIPTTQTEEHPRIVLWKLDQNGQEVPVLPKQPPVCFLGDQGDLSSPEGDENPMTPSLNTRVSNEAKTMVPTPPSRDSSSEQSPFGDAYEDVTRHMEDDPEITQRHAMALNRSFGIKTTRTTASGEPSCISDDEFEAMELAFTEGLREAETFKHCLENPQDPALLRSREEVERSKESSNINGLSTSSGGYF